MKTILISLVTVALLTIPLLLLAQENFDDYFIDKTMRIDYFHVGNSKDETITIDVISQQGAWAGSTKNLIDDRNIGRYYYKVYDTASKKLIFSKGFDAYFGEYKTVDEAIKGIKKSYHESALIPYPKKKILFTVELRNRKNILEKIFEQEIDPASTNINKEPLSSDTRVLKIHYSGEPHSHLDIAVIAEGYTAAEEPKAIKDFNRFAKTMLSQEPYKKMKDKINIYGVLKFSQESGCDEPSHGSFKNTALDATFDSLGSERYLMTENNKKLRDVAAAAPYDALVIMVNHKRYGGGGIYNLFSVFTTDNQWYEYLIIHEFGHSFAGLADEYYNSASSYNDFYPRGVEPVEPNITALLKPKDLKWKTLASKGIEIPTPWEKEDFDKMDLAYQKIRQELNKKLAEMKRSGAPKDDIAKLEKEIEERSRKSALDSDNYLAKSKFVGKVGAFEGAGYSSKGLYRPMLDCIMFTKGFKPFCKVCEEAIARAIKHYTND
jgi:hypothetical protein